MSPALQARDPYNRLFARGPRFRMEAEMVRDVALAASGQLSPKVGGPSVFPPQPPNIWDNPYDNSTLGREHRRGPRTAAASTRSTGAPRRTRCSRRSTAPTARSAPCGACAPTRRCRPWPRSTTRASSSYARALAGRIRTEAAPATVDARITLGFRLVTSRAPTVQELARLRTFHAQARARYAAAPAEALEALGLKPGATPTADQLDLAAWTMVGNVLLNLDETVTKG